MEARYDNPDSDPRGAWTSGDLSARNYYSEGTYPVTCPSGRIVEGPPPGTYWRVSKEKFLDMNRDGRIWWGKDGNGTPRLKRFLSEVKQGRVPQTLWPYSEVGHTQDAKKELLEYVTFEHTDNVLDTVKPVALIQRMLQLATRATGRRYRPRLSLAAVGRPAMPSSPRMPMTVGTGVSFLFNFRATAKPREVAQNHRRHMQGAPATGDSKAERR